MKEQSHKAEMSAALRGDFERLRARGVSAALVPQDESEPDEEPVAESAEVVEEIPPVAPEERSGGPVVPHADPIPGEVEADAEQEHGMEAGENPQARRGWFSRFAGR